MCGKEYPCNQPSCKTNGNARTFNRQGIELPPPPPVGPPTTLVVTSDTQSVPAATCVLSAASAEEATPLLLEMMTLKVLEEL